MFFAGCAASENFDGSLLAKSSSADYSAAVKELDASAAMISRLEYTAATEKLQPIVRTLQQAGDIPRAAEAEFWIAYCHEKTGQVNAARTAYQNVISHYPQTKSAKQARERLDIMSGR